MLVWYGDNNKCFYCDSRTNVWTNKGAAEVPGAMHTAVRQYLKQLSDIVTTVLPWTEFLECLSERYHIRLPDKPPSWCPKEMSYTTTALTEEKYGNLTCEKADPLLTIHAAASFAMATPNQNGAVAQYRGLLGPRLRAETQPQHGDRRVR